MFMNNKKYTAIFIILVLCLSMGFNARYAKTVWSLEAAQTIPTRTSVPPPTVPPAATQPSGGVPNSTATHTPPAGGEPGPSPTSTLLPAAIAPTPVGGFLPTAVPCSSSPTIQTLGATNVRSGPGLEYEVVGQLVYLEVRYIVGRAESAKWWLIQFNNGQFGWVANDIVLVQGYTPIIPIVEAPPLNGITPTPGAAWNPTPFPFCTVTPPPTNTSTPAAELAEAPPVETATAAPTEPPPPTEPRPTDTPIVQPTAVPLNTPTPAATAVPAQSEAGGSRSGILLLGLGLLIGAGLVITYLRKR
jgi:hypothetical protein